TQARKRSAAPAPGPMGATPSSSARARALARIPSSATYSSEWFQLAGLGAVTVVASSIGAPDAQGTRWGAWPAEGPARPGVAARAGSGTFGRHGPLGRCAGLLAGPQCRLSRLSTSVPSVEVPDVDGPDQRHHPQEQGAPHEQARAGRRAGQWAGQWA